MYRIGILDETNVADANATPLHVVVGSVVVAGLFGLCAFVLELYWAITFSICFAYATSVHRAFQTILKGAGRAGSRTRQAQRRGV